MANVNHFNQYLLASHIAVPLLTVKEDDTHDLVKMYFNTYRFDVIGYKEENHVIGFLDRASYDDTSLSI